MLLCTGELKTTSTHCLETMGGHHWRQSRTKFNGILQHLEKCVGNTTKANAGLLYDAETRLPIKDNILGKDPIIVQPTFRPVNDHLTEFVVIFDSLKRASSKRITPVITYFGHGRHARKTSARVPMTTKLVTDLMQAVGAHRVRLV